MKMCEFVQWRPPCERTAKRCLHFLLNINTCIAIMLSCKDSLYVEMITFGESNYYKKALYNYEKWWCQGVCIFRTIDVFLNLWTFRVQMHTLNPNLPDHTSLVKTIDSATPINESWKKGSSTCKLTNSYHWMVWVCPKLQTLPFNTLGDIVWNLWCWWMCNLKKWRFRFWILYFDC